MLAAVAGLGVGHAVNRAAGAFPWGAPQHKEPGAGGVAVLERTRTLAVRPPVVEVGTAALFALTALAFGWSADLPAFLVLAGAAVLLTVVDLQHRQKCGVKRIGAHRRGGEDRDLSTNPRIDDEGLAGDRLNGLNHERQVGILEVRCDGLCRLLLRIA